MKTVTTTTIDDVLNELNLECKQWNPPSTNPRLWKVVRRANKDPLLRKFVGIMSGKELAVELDPHKYFLRISGAYNSRVNLLYDLAANPLYGYELRQFFGPEVTIRSSSVTVRTDGKNEYIHLPYIPGDGFSNVNGGAPDYCTRTSLAWNYIKNKLGVGITGETMVIHRKTSVSLREVPDEEVKMLANYFGGK